MKATLRLVLLLGFALTTSFALRAQTPEPPPAPAAQPSSQAELDSWLGPIALYPDPLLAQVLGAATQPSDVVLANRYLANGGDPSQIDAQPWDASVKALSHYPGVLKMMVDYLPWTTALGQLYQENEPAVMDEIQHLRAEAMDLGNLESTPEENVIDEDGAIEILPAESDVIYIPDYESDVVYSQPMGPGYITFGPRCPMGFWMNRDFNWHRHEVWCWDRSHQRPADWWSGRQPNHSYAHHWGHRGHGDDSPENARTRTTHFVLWQVPQVQVVGTGSSGGRGPQAGGVYQHHIERLASTRPSSSSLVVLPNRGAVPARSTSGGAFQVFDSSRPVHAAETPGGHHTAEISGRADGFHGAQQLNHLERGNHEAVSPSHVAGSHSAPAQHVSAESHASTSAPASTHASAPSHPSGGAGRH